MTTTNDNAPPYVAGQPCDRCRGTHGEGDAATGERLPCTRCFGLSPRSTSAPPLDLDAIDARERAALAAVRERLRCERLDADATVALTREERRADDAVALVARVRELAGKLDASAQAFDDIVAQVWRATGETHEPPADVAALLRRVSGLAAMVFVADQCIAAGRREGAEAMREACVARCEVVALLHSPTARAVYAESVARALRTIPLHGGDP